jgi:hypothetical protein
MYLAYTYFVRNKITDQFYYGSRYKNVKYNRSAINDLWIYYFTSSDSVLRLVDLYGKKSFETSIVYESNDYDACYWKEQTLISENIDNILCLNKHYTRDGKVKFLRAGIVLSDETKNKMSAAKKGKSHSTEHNRKVSVSLKQKYNSDIKPKSTRFRKSATEETKLKMSQANILRPRLECIHCGNRYDPGNYNRYHGPKCKMNR